MKTQASDHRKGCQCQTCLTTEHEENSLLERLNADATTIVDVANGWIQKHKHADAAQGEVTTNPDGSIAYRHVPIVEEKQK